MHPPSIDGGFSWNRGQAFVAGPRDFSIGSVQCPQLTQVYRFPDFR